MNCRYCNQQVFLHNFYDRKRRWATVDRRHIWSSHCLLAPINHQGYRMHDVEPLLAMALEAMDE